MKYQAFTLIELLVVIAIIGLLSALLFPNYMSARERARDSQRKSDLKQIQNALEMYKLDQSLPSYPSNLPDPGQCWNQDGGVSSCSSSDVIYLKTMPADPSGSEYTYQYDSTNITYDLCACLENKADVDGVDCNLCSINPCTDQNRKCYKITQP